MSYQVSFQFFTSNLSIIFQSSCWHVQNH